MARVVKSREAATDLIKLFVFFGKHSIASQTASSRRLTAPVFD